MMTIYLDVCCLNRLLNDDQTQARIRQEATAIRLILRRCWASEWRWISSEVVEDEIEQTPDADRKARLRWLAAFAAEVVQVTPSAVARARELQLLGFHAKDSLHIACAESTAVDVFLTTDDRLLRRGTRFAADLNVVIANPQIWLTEVQRNEQDVG